MHKDLQKRKEYQREFRRLNPIYIKDINRKYHLKRNYGLTIDQYEDLWLCQEGKCALCKRHESEFSRGYKLAVDHCHVTGKIRGLVCYPCNSILSKGVTFFERGVEYFQTLPTGLSGNTIIRKPEVTEINREGKVIYR